MRFLADMGVSLTTVEALRGAITTRSTSVMKVRFGFPTPRSAKAVTERRIVLTFDLDFGDILAVARSEAPGVIIFRLRNQTPAAVNPRLFRVIAGCEAELASGAILIVENDGFRVRRLPIEP